MSDVRLVLRLLLLAAVPVVGGWTSCEPDLNKDPSFDRWCGESLCYWQTDAGSIKRVPTWHPDDYAVELVGNPAAISQRIDVPPGTEPAWCLRFDTLADIAPTATVMLAFDYGDDGSIEYQTPVAGNDWVAVQLLFTAPRWYPAVRIRLNKTGEGRAVLAHIQITASTDCTEAPHEVYDRPLGAYCGMDEECQSGICPENGIDHHACGGCRAGAECETGKACRTLEADGGIHRECAPPGEPGTYCTADGECASGSCGTGPDVRHCTGTLSATCDTDDYCEQVVGADSTCAAGFLVVPVCTGTLLTTCDTDDYCEQVVRPGSECRVRLILGVCQ